MSIFSEQERDILLSLIDSVDVDDFSDDEWEALNVIQRKVESA